MPDDSLSDEEVAAKVEQLRAREGVPAGATEAVDAGTVVDAVRVDRADVPGDYPLDVGPRPLRLSVRVGPERTETTYLDDPRALADATGVAADGDPAEVLVGREVVLDYRGGHHLVDVSGTGATREAGLGRAFRALPVLAALVAVGAALTAVTPHGWALLGVGWVGLPVAVAADARSLPAWVDWNPSTAWVAGAALYPLNVGVAAAYAVRRWVRTTPPAEQPPRDAWVALLAAGVALWPVTYALGQAGAPGALYVLAMGTAWAAVPLAVQFDAEMVARRTAWTPLDLLWVLAAAFWALGAVAGVVYLGWRTWRLRRLPE